MEKFFVELEKGEKFLYELMSLLYGNIDLGFIYIMGVYMVLEFV